jgi:hypothetical protein
MMEAAVKDATSVSNPIIENANPETQEDALAELRIP